MTNVGLIDERLVVYSSEEVNCSSTPCVLCRFTISYAGAYRPYRKYRKCGMAGGDVPRGAPSGKNKKKMERDLAGRRPARAFGLRSANVGGDRSPRGPWYGPRGGPGTARGGPDTVRGRNICRNICDI